MRRFGSNGLPIGGQFLVNTYTTNEQIWPSVAVAPSGDFVVAWESYGSDTGDSSLESVAGQLYRVALFGDGFESGDFSAWSAVVP